MRKLTYPLFGLVLAGTAAQAQDAADQSASPAAPEAEAAAPAAPAPAEPAAAPAAPADAAPAAETAGPAAPADAGPAAPAASAAASAEFTDQQIDQFAQATVKVQAIDSDAAIAAEQKQSQMVAAVTEVGLDPATYNKIGRAVAVDPELRTRVQTAMSRHTTTTTGASADPSES